MLAKIQAQARFAGSMREQSISLRFGALCAARVTEDEKHNSGD